jgi:hypothetical protein
MKRLLLMMPVLLVLSSRTMAQTIPNSGFENWTSVGYSDPDSLMAGSAVPTWVTSNASAIIKNGSANVTKVSGYTAAAGDSAVHLQTIITGTDTSFAFITNTIAGNLSSGKGGIPFAGFAQNITGQWRYAVGGNDTALILVGTKKNGNCHYDTIKIHGTLSTWTPFSIQLHNTLGLVDSIIIAAASSNALANYGITNGTWLELDELAITGPSSNPIIPGGTFNMWNPTSVSLLTGWNINSNGGPTGVSSSTSAYAGTYAAQLMTLGGAAAISTGKFAKQGPPTGGQPYSYAGTDTLFGYYKYSPVGADTASVMVSTSHLHVSTGMNMIPLTSAANYTLFKLPVMASSTPDTMRIDVMSSIKGQNAPLGSTLYVDDFWLKSSTVEVPNVNGSISNFIAYPNPTHNVLSIRYTGSNAFSGSVKVMDMTGKIMFQQQFDGSNPVVRIPVNQYAAGVYIYEINDGSNIARNTFVKQ